MTLFSWMMKYQRNLITSISRSSRSWKEERRDEDGNIWSSGRDMMMVRILGNQWRIFDSLKLSRWWRSLMLLKVLNFQIKLNQQLMQLSTLKLLMIRKKLRNKLKRKSELESKWLAVKILNLIFKKQSKHL